MVNQLPVHVVHCNKEMNQHILNTNMILRENGNVLLQKRMTWQSNVINYI